MTGHDPFGDVLPDRTRDEEAAGWGDTRRDADADTDTDDDERLRREVPPHHH
jgi:hypothetical protein